MLDHRTDFLDRTGTGWGDLLFDHRQRWLEMFGLETAAGVFEQRAAEQAFGLVVFNVVIAPTAAPAVGLAQFAPSAGRINRPAELGDIDEGFDHQHRMAVMGLPIGGKPIQAQATVTLNRAPSDPLVAMLKMLGWSAEDQQGKPLTLGIGGHVVEAFAYRFEPSQIVMLIEQLFETLQFDALHKPHLDLV